MYKYIKDIYKHTGIVFVVFYCIGALRVKSYIDRYGNNELYCRLIVWHPMLWVTFIVVLVVNLVCEAIRLFYSGINEIVELNKENFGKGGLICSIKNDQMKSNEKK